MKERERERMVRVLDRGGKKLMTVLDPPEDRIRATEKIVRLTYIYIKYILEGRRPSPPLSISLEEEEEEEKRGSSRGSLENLHFRNVQFPPFSPPFLKVPNLSLLSSRFSLSPSPPTS